VSSDTQEASAGPAVEMQIEWDVQIPMDDGVVLRADVFRPGGEVACPVILSYGPYGKNLSFQEGYPAQWNSMVDAYPDVEAGSSNVYQAWEVVDPEKWVPHGYAVVRVDSRGAGRSPGYIDCFSPRETNDLYECVEWAGTRPWSNGKVGLSGISYYAVNQWQVAALHPPHLAAICPWEGAADWYRDAGYHGGVPSPFLGRWFPRQVGTVQYGLGTRGDRHPHTGILVSGDADLTDDELAANRGDLMTELREHPFLDAYWTDRTSDLTTITTPLLSSGNWGGQGLHLRGNIEGYLQAGSTQKWLEIHGGAHWAVYYTDYGVTLQRRFFDRFLKDEGDWDQQPPVLLNIRRPGERFTPRAEHEWPLARTRWTTLYLDPGAGTMRARQVAACSATYRGFGAGLTLLADPFERETEITGPLAAKLWISSSTEDTDLFLVLHLFDPDGDEVLFHGATEPKQPISQGWLRASHRELDADRSKPWRPVHPHQRYEPLEPGVAYELDVEIWPTCIVAPAGYRLGLSVLGRDYDHGLPGSPSHLGYELRGCGLNVHDDPDTRPAAVYDGEVTLYGGGDRPSQLLVPVIPAAEGER
jgi:uncharacterized protein